MIRYPYVPLHIMSLSVLNTQVHAYKYYTHKYLYISDTGTNVADMEAGRST